MIEDLYNINLLDVNKTKIQLKIVGVSLTVYLETKGTENLIRQTKSGQLQNYINKLEIYADDIDQARNIIAALNTSIEKSKLINPDFKTVQEATEFIEHNTGEITPANKKINQKIDFKVGNAHGVTFTNEEMDSKGNVLKNMYEFYLSDINPTSLQFAISGKKIALELKTQNKTNLIKYTKQAELQNFVSEIEILNDDIEITRELIYAYNFAIKESITAPIKWESISAANEFLNSTFKGDRIGTDQYKLAFEADNSDPYQCKYKKSITDSKGVETAEQCLFYPFTIDPEQIKIESAGKYLIVSSFTKSKSYYIKKTKKELSHFDNDLEMISFDAKQAKDIASAIKYLSINALPKQKDWNSKAAAMNYVAQTIGNFSSIGKEIKQKLELVDNDPSKVSYKVFTVDNNGKSLEEIYEFSLTDMNRLMVEFKTQGENVIISMTCKNRNKFVKVYKNGEQQVYCSVVEITEKDINTAKNIADALRYTIIKCE